MKWLGLDWDGDTVYQFARADRHREVAEALLAKGAAYGIATPTAGRIGRNARTVRARKAAPPRYDRI